MMIRNRHDSLFKFTFGKAENAASVLVAVLPKAISKQIDFSRMVLQPGSFIDVELKSRHTDLLYRAPLHGGGEVLAYLLYEHQSTLESAMPLRMLGYLVRIWWAFRRDNPGARLPPIVPIVIYHGTEPWTAPTQMSEMYDEAINLSEFDDLLPAARFIVDDLSAVSDDELRGRAMTGMAEVALGTLKYIHDADALMTWLLSSMKALNEVWRAPDGLRAIEALTRYILTNNDVAEQAVGDTLGQVLGEEAREVAMTTAQRLFEEGEQLGLERGREEGREEGEELGLAKGARKLITKRFGELDEESLERFEALDLDGLAVIYEEIFTAEGLNELLKHAEAHQADE